MERGSIRQTNFSLLSKGGLLYLVLPVLIVPSVLVLTFFCIQRKSNPPAETVGSTQHQNTSHSSGPAFYHFNNSGSTGGRPAGGNTKVSPDLCYENCPPVFTLKDSPYQNIDPASRDQDQSYSTISPIPHP